MGRDRSRGGLVWLAVGGLAPIAAVTATPLVGMPLASMLAIAAVFYVCAGVAVALDPEVRAVTVGALRAAPRGAEARPTMVRTIAAPRAAMRASVVGAEGVCPLGYRVGDTWTVSADGRLSQPICAPAASSLGTLFKPGAQARKAPRVAACTCPLGPQRVHLSAEPAAAS